MTIFPYPLRQSYHVAYVTYSPLISFIFITTKPKPIKFSTSFNNVHRRSLTLLGEFKPFGLIAKALNGKSIETVTENYGYFLFNPRIARDSDAEDHCDEVASALNNRGNHELFNSRKTDYMVNGSRVFKRFTMDSSIVKVCWCHLSHTAEALVCILQIDRLTIHSTYGGVVSVQLPRTVTSIWPLPFGLLFQQEVEASTSPRLSFSSTNPLLSTRDVLLSASNHIQKRDGSLVSSHLILMDPLDEYLPTFIEERGKLNVKTIWASGQDPLMASYNKDKILHGLELPEASSLSNVLKITGLADAVEGRVNVIVNNKQMFSCSILLELLG